MMRTHLLLAFGPLVAVAALAAPSFADEAAPPPAAAKPDPAKDKGPANPPPHPEFNVATVETLKGEITAIVRRTPRRKEMARMIGAGIHAMLKTDKETIELALGPAPFLDKQEVKLAAKDLVEVKGSRVTMDEKPLLIAEQVVKGDKILVLRQADGTPTWRGMFGGHKGGHGPGKGMGMGMGKGKGAGKGAPPPAN